MSANHFTVFYRAVVLVFFSLLQILHPPKKIRGLHLCLIFHEEEHIRVSKIQILRHPVHVTRNTYLVNINVNSSKVGCVYPMVVLSLPPRAQPTLSKISKNSNSNNLPFGLKLLII